MHNFTLPFIVAAAIAAPAVNANSLDLSVSDYEKRYRIGFDADNSYQAGRAAELEGSVRGKVVAVTYSQESNAFGQPGSLSITGYLSTDLTGNVEERHYFSSSTVALYNNNISELAYESVGKAEDSVWGLSVEKSAQDGAVIPRIGVAYDGYWIETREFKRLQSFSTYTKGGSPEGGPPFGFRTDTWAHSVSGYVGVGFPFDVTDKVSVQIDARIAPLTYTHGNERKSDLELKSQFGWNATADLAVTYRLDTGAKIGVKATYGQSGSYEESRDYSKSNAVALTYTLPL